MQLRKWIPATLALMTASLVARADVLPAGEPAEEAVGFRINASGYDFIEEQFEAVVTPETLQELLNSTTPLEVTNQCGFFEIGVTARIDAFTDISWSSLSFELIPVDGGLDISLTLLDPFLRFDLAGDWLFCAVDYSCDSWIDADSFTLNGTGRIELLPDGQASFDVTEVSSSLNGLEFNTGFDCVIVDIAIDILDALFGTVSDGFEGAVESVVDGGLPPVVEAVLNQLSFSGQLNLLGMPFQYALDTSAIDQLQGASVQLFDSSLQALQTSECVVPLAGSEYTPNPAPAMDTVTGSDVALTVSDDFFNQIMLATYDSGVICLTVDQELVGDAIELNTVLLLLFAPAVFDAYPFAPIQLVLQPASAPVVQVGGVEPDDLNVVFSDLAIDTYVLAEDRWLRAFQLTGDVEATLALALEPDDTLSLEVGRVSVDVAVTVEELIDIDDFLVTLFLEPLLEAALPELFALLDSFALPSLGGIQLVLTDAVVEGSGSDYLTFYADLETVPVGAPLEPSRPGVDMSGAYYDIHVSPRP